MACITCGDKHITTQLPSGKVLRADHGASFGCHLPCSEAPGGVGGGHGACSTGCIRDAGALAPEWQCETCSENAVQRQLQADGGGKCRPNVSLCLPSAGICPRPGCPAHNCSLCNSASALCRQQEYGRQSWQASHKLSDANLQVKSAYCWVVTRVQIQHIL